ncbi:MAG: membrane protein insertion efficiency factor YidD [Candidatus Caldipriscus sp.]
MTKFLILVIQAYRKYISPLKPPTCRYYPTCSEYAMISLQKYGLFKGTLKSIWRILRCNPFSKGGIDLP